MSQGLQVFDASGRTVFDSTLATGGVSLGFFQTVTGDSVFSFPAFTSGSGYALSAGGYVGSFYYTVDFALGYLRFIFPGTVAGFTIVLFAK